MAAPTSGHVAPGWSRFTLTPPGQPSEGYVPGDAPGVGIITGVTAAEIGIDGRGEAVAAWERYRNPGPVIEASTRQSGGGWSAPIDIGGGGDVRLAVSTSGAAIAVWENLVAGRTVLESSYRSPGGSWSAPVGLGPGSGSADPEVAIGASGEAAVLWERKAGKTMLIESAFRDPLGGWSMQGGLGGGSAEALIPQIAIGPTGEAVAIWRLVRHGDSVVESATRAPGGSWTPAVRLSARGEDPDAGVPRIAVDAAGEAVAVWEVNHRVGHHYETTILSASRPAGAAWSAPIRVTSEQEAAEGLELALSPSGEAAIVWERERHFHSAVESAFRSVGGAWSAPVPIRHTADNFDSQVAINAAGEAVLVFLALRRNTQRGGSSSVESAFHSPGRGWSVPQTVVVDREEDPIYDPEVVLSPAGEEVAIWGVWNYRIEEELIDQIYRGASHPKF